MGAICFADHKRHTSRAEAIAAHATLPDNVNNLADRHPGEPEGARKRRILNSCRGAARDGQHGEGNCIRTLVEQSWLTATPLDHMDRRFFLFSCGRGPRLAARMISRQGCDIAVPRVPLRTPSAIRSGCISHHDPATVNFVS